MSRFIVVSVGGYVIDQASSGQSITKAVSYSVLDTVYAYREVGQFVPRQGVSTRVSKERAEAFCDELNERDRADLASDGVAA